MNEEFIKLTNSVYKILEYFPEDDPLKNRAKDKVLLIMSALGGSASGGENSIQEDIDMLLSYLKIGRNQGWMSAINYFIISNEYDKIRTQIVPDTVLDNSGIEETVKPESFVKLSDRQSKILDFLSKNEKAQVMDIRTILPDVTKRTIRRDLDELLKIGKITRLGEFNQVFYKAAN